MGLPKDHYRNGWNGLAHGILTWSESSSEKWTNALEWALHCKQVAIDCKPKAIGAHNVAYYDGCIDAANEYQSTGAIKEIGK